jgi:hypothetical protein
MSSFGEHGCWYSKAHEGVSPSCFQQDPRKQGDRKAACLGKGWPLRTLAKVPFFKKVLKINEQNIERSALAAEG